MDLDHFRPKSRKEFEHLTNHPRNLLYACKRCNGLKIDWWPALSLRHTFVGQSGFLDPFAVDRRKFFTVSFDGAIQPKRPPAKYMIALLALDRPFLRQLRELRVLKQELIELAKLLRNEATACLAAGANADPTRLSRIALLVAERIERLPHID